MTVDSGPLHGIKVLEIGSFIAGPYCGMLLADLGADVIKIEDPGRGDSLRSNEPKINGESAIFMQVNRGKRSVALDLKTDEGRATFMALLADVDAVVENLRPGAMQRLGLDAETLVATFPRLVYLAVSGWGRSGPYSARAGLDIVAQGASGLMSITGDVGGQPNKSGIPVCDLSCALYGALAVTAALRARDQTGRGQLVEVNLFEAGTSLTTWEMATYGATGRVPSALGSAHQNSAPYQALRASDGYFTLGASTNHLWHRTCAVLGLDELLEHPLFVDGASRWANREELAARIEQVTVHASSSEWVRRLNEQGVPAGPVQTYDQVIQDPHLNSRGFFVDVDHPVAGPVRVLGSAIRFGRSAPAYAPSPQLGQHTEEVLAELGRIDGAPRPLVEPSAAGRGELS